MKKGVEFSFYLGLMVSGIYFVEVFIYDPEERVLATDARGGLSDERA